MPEIPGVADDAPLFRERLLPGPGTWIVLVAFGILLGPVIAPFPAWAAITISAVSLALIVFLAIFSSPVVEIAGGEVRAGRAHAPIVLFGDAETLDREQWKQTLGVDFAPLEHHVTRGWVSTGVRVPLHDPQDPTPAWVISVRRPDDFAAALRAAHAQGLGAGAH